MAFVSGFFNLIGDLLFYVLVPLWLSISFYFQLALERKEVGKASDEDSCKESSKIPEKLLICSIAFIGTDILLILSNIHLGIISAIISAVAIFSCITCMFILARTKHLIKGFFLLGFDMVIVFWHSLSQVFARRPSPSAILVPTFIMFMLLLVGWIIARMLLMLNKKSTEKESKESEKSDKSDESDESDKSDKSDESDEKPEIEDSPIVKPVKPAHKPEKKVQDAEFCEPAQDDLAGNDPTKRQSSTKYTDEELDKFIEMFSAAMERYESLNSKS